MYAYISSSHDINYKKLVVFERSSINFDLYTTQQTYNNLSNKILPLFRIVAGKD